MNRCKQCGLDVTGKRQFCDDRCRMAFNRSQSEQSEQTEHEQPEQMKPNTQPEQVASLEHYHANPDQYATRANPELLNWGEPMSLNELGQAKLKANRVTIPGDWDYTTSQEAV